MKRKVKANDHGLTFCDIMSNEKGKHDDYQIFVSCLMHNATGPSNETVLIPFRADEKGQASSRTGRKRSNRKSKLFYVSCDYLDMDASFEEQVRAITDPKYLSSL